MSVRPRAVLLDAFGTLVTLDAPAPLLRALLAERLGAIVTDAQAATALAAEVSYYRAHMHEGVDLERVARLHASCAEVLRRALPAEPVITQATPGVVTELLLDSLRFGVFADVPEVLARVGLLDAVDGVVNSASAGFAKPDPRLLQSALLLAGVAPAAALHVGDSFREDVGAALGAGVSPVLLARGGRGTGPESGAGESLLPPLRVIETLAELPALVGL